jgi:threonine/homoserine/homoserine lactone efflux protein
MDLKLDPKIIFLIAGLLSVFVGALLLIGQAALARRYKEISERLTVRTSMPGLTFIFLGIVLLVGFWLNNSP